MSIKVTPILGVVAVKSGGEIEVAKSANNNTRWMFDIEGSMGEEPLVLQLIEMRTGKDLTPDLLSCAFLPRSSSFHDAKPFLADQDGGLITIRHGGFVRGPQVALPEAPPNFSRGIECRYRVMVDVLHTATR